jgi:hypothetical protein
MTRAEEFQEVIRLLGRPKPQSPDPDLIVGQLFRTEQLMLNQLNGTGKGWATQSVTITTVADQAEYTIALAGTVDYGFGKPLFVYRALSDGSPMPVPLADFSHEIYNQQHEFWVTPAGESTLPGYTTEKIGFFRTSDGSIKARVYPIPDEAGLIYTIVYAPGEVLWDEHTTAGSVPLPEFSVLRTLQTALFLLPYAKWEGYTEPDNLVYRQQIKESLAEQVRLHTDEYQAYIRNPQHEPFGDSGYWWG